MQPLVIYIVLLSAAMYAPRSVLNKWASDKQAFVWWCKVCGLLFFTPVFIVTLIHKAPVSPIPLRMILFSGFAHFSYWYCLCKTLENGELPLAFPIIRSSPVLAALLSFLVLGETFTWVGVTGILKIAFGVYMINMDRLTIPALIQPFRAATSDRAVQFAFLTLFSISAYTLADNWALHYMHPIVLAYGYTWISLSLFSGYIFKTKTRETLRTEWIMGKWAILACGGLSIFGYFLILLAFTMAPASYIVGFRQISIVFTVLVGGHLLKEKKKAIRLSASAFIIAGACLITVAD